MEYKGHFKNKGSSFLILSQCYGESTLQEKNQHYAIIFKFPLSGPLKATSESPADAPAGNEFAIQQMHPLRDGKMHLR